jgi:hypothetical protein
MIRSFFIGFAVLISCIHAEVSNVNQEAPSDPIFANNVDLDSLPLREWATAKPSDFILEAAILLALAIYILVYVVGNAKNKELARAW